MVAVLRRCASFTPSPEPPPRLPVNHLRNRSTERGTRTLCFAVCERYRTIFRPYLLGPFGVRAGCPKSRRRDIRSRPARVRSRFACSVSFDLANSIFEGQAFLGDHRFRERRVNGAKLRYLRRARPFVEGPASLPRVQVKPLDGIGDQRTIVGHRNKPAQASCIILLQTLLEK